MCWNTSVCMHAILTCFYWNGWDKRTIIPSYWELPAPFSSVVEPNLYIIRYKYVWKSYIDCLTRSIRFLLYIKVLRYQLLLHQKFMSMKCYDSGLHTGPKSDWKPESRKLRTEDRTEKKSDMDRTESFFFQSDPGLDWIGPKLFNMTPCNFRGLLIFKQNVVKKKPFKL